MDEHYTDLNAKAVDAWVEDGWEWGVPVGPEQCARARAGDWQVLLSPQVPAAWFAPFISTVGRLDGVRLLGLASGGGQQMPLFACAGAVCTVLDYSERQLENERLVAGREGYAIDIVRADMSRRLPFDDAGFDMIFHPISNCYVEDVCHVWRECFRVLRPGGVLLAGMDNGANFLFDEEDDALEKGRQLVAKNKLPYNPLKDPALLEQGLAETGSVQFSHSLTEQLGGQLEAGLALTHLYEDRDPASLIARYCPQFIATRAVKPR